MATELRIARDLSLPLDVLTEAVGIIATRGAGKTYGSVVLIEEAHDAGVPFVVIDPTGVYHGLRSSADGKRDGLPVYVIYPEGVTRDELADRAEITRSSGTFSDYLSALRRNNLAVDRHGLVYCGDALFLGGRR